MTDISRLEKLYPKSYLLEYIKRTKSGEILIGRELMAMLDILLEHFDDPEIRFETADSDKRIHFIETQCKFFEAPFAGKPFILTLRQKAFIEAFYSFKIYDDEIERWVRLYTEFILLIGRKCGKALSLDTPIPTPNGWKTMCEMEIGDIVFNELGEPTRVVATSETFVGHDCYIVTFEDGETITADAEHIWHVMTKNSRRVAMYKPKSSGKCSRDDCRMGNGYSDTTTAEMASDFVRVRSDGKGREYKYRVPIAKALQYPEKSLPIEPYLLGVWLGDGESSGARISVAADELDDFIKRIENAGGIIVSVKKDRKCMRVRISQRKNCLQTELKKMGLIGNKHIPDIFMQSSVAQRYELLKGLMDTDGYCDKRGQCEFTQKNKLVVDGLCELLSSLGIKNRVTTKKAKCNGKDCGLVYRVLFFTDQEHSCFNMFRKHEKLKESLSPRMLNKSIVDIKKVESVPTKCIGVDSPQSLYLAGRNMTVTHNTPLVAAMDLAEFFCGEIGTRILCSSNDYEQAALMFDAINSMREESPAIEKVTRKNIKGIHFGNPKRRKKRGKFSYQNKGWIKKISAKTGAKEGKNIKVGSVDEVHELTDNSSIMPIRQALSTQDEPIYGEMTTEGFTEDGYLDGRLKEARKVLKGELNRPRWLIWLHTQDSEEEIWQDERTWVKSNPDLGTIKKWRFLREMVEEAKTNSATRAFVLAKDFNIKQSSAVSWLQEAEIINKATFDIEDFRGAWYIGGADFAETTDLCAFKMLLKKPDDPMVYFYSHYWIPNSKLKDAPDDVDYEQWQRDGYLTIVPGNSVESSVVADWQFNLLLDYDLKPFKVGYDNRFAKDYINHFNELFDDGGSARTLENVPQEPKCLNNPMRKLEADLRQKLVNYNNCHGDLVCFRNTGVKTDPLGRIQPAKKETKKRIDGTAAAVIAYAVFDWHKAEFQTLINS